MKEWKLRLKEYGISDERYMELKYIALQYAENKKSSDPRRREKAAAVEAAVEAAEPSLAKYVLMNVTEKRRFEEMPVPAGINQFFKARRRFFVELDKRVN